MTTDAYIVDVDLERLRTRHGRLDNCEYSEQDVRLFLVRNGFYPRPDGLYLAEAAVLQQLDPSEIIAARPVAILDQ